MIEWNGFLSIKAPEGTEEYLNDYDRLILFPHGTFGSSFNILFLEDGADYPDD